MFLTCPPKSSQIGKLSFLDTPLQVKRRRWTKPRLEDTFREDRVLINIRQAVMDHRGFKQVLEPENGTPSGRGRQVSWNLESAGELAEEDHIV